VSENGTNPNHVKASEKVGEEATVQEAGAQIFLNMLNETKLLSGPAQMSGGWAMVEVDRDGRKVPNAVLLLAQNNTVAMYWFDLPGMEDFVQNSTVLLAGMRQATMASMPLIAANPEQMQQAIQAKDRMDKFGSKKDIDWPPANGRFSL